MTDDPAVRKVADAMHVEGGCVVHNDDGDMPGSDCRYCMLIAPALVNAARPIIDDLHDALLALYRVVKDEVAPLYGVVGRYAMYTHEDDQKITNASDRITDLLRPRAAVETEHAP